MFFAAADLFSATSILKAAGLLIYPLGLCSAVLVFIVCERAYALRQAAIVPQDLVDAVVNGRPLLGGKHTVLARIVDFAEQHKNDAGAVKAFARLELNRMERGIPYLDIVYAAAPLIGLSGTVIGLMRVFPVILPKNAGDMPGPAEFGLFLNGVSTALGATIIGLFIAIPALFCAGYFQRRIDKYAAQLDLLLERILNRGKA